MLSLSLSHMCPVVLSNKVAGCLKNIAVVWYGVVAHLETVSAAQMIGYAVSVAGFAMYSKLKMTVQVCRPLVVCVKFLAVHLSALTFLNFVT